MFVQNSAPFAVKAAASLVGRYEEKERCNMCSGSLELSWVTPHTHTHTHTHTQTHPATLSFSLFIK